MQGNGDDYSVHEEAVHVAVCLLLNHMMDAQLAPLSLTSLLSCTLPLTSPALTDGDDVVLSHSNMFGSAVLSI